MPALLGRIAPALGLGPALALLLALLAVPALAQVAGELPAREADEVLTGTITRADHQTYLRAPFVLPEGTERLVVAFDYDHREERTTIDLGIDDPNGFRGASGGNKASFTIAATDATPSYLPGPLPAGEWALALAVPNIREGVTARWTARLWFLKGGEAQWLGATPTGRGPGWYRGDLHLHSGHSDGSCESRGGRRVPCPLYRTIAAAAERGLDFVAVTEHNTVSQAGALRELAPAFDDMLLIPGREVTTFFGHFNVFGVTSFLDYRIAPGRSASFASVAAKVHALGGIVSINHPALPSGEACMGCGWTMPEADLALADAVEVVNGSASAAAGGAEGPLAGFPFWLDAMEGGQPLAAVGGSDNHDPALEDERAVGVPTTVVFAEDLTQAAILDGIRQGRVFVDVAGSGAVHLDFTLRAGEAAAAMGGALAAAPEAPITLAAQVRAPAGAVLEVLDGAQILASQPLAASPVELVVEPGPAAGRHAIWLKLRGADGALLATSSAVLVTRD